MMIRILSANILLSTLKTRDWNQRENECTQTLRNTNADILLIQECSDVQLKSLQNALGDVYQIYAHNPENPLNIIFLVLIFFLNSDTFKL